MVHTREKRVIGFTELREKYLPHRYPLLYLDRITDYSPKEYIEAIKCITGNSLELVGHFPERAIMPGTCVIQAFAQLAIVFFKISNGFLRENELTLISSVNFRFLAPIIPGETIELRMKPKQINESVGIFVGEAKVGSKRVTAGTVTLSKTNLDRFSEIPW
jgi:3-hydroxyacyl-[acyl-carrier-protein] dehydratase